MLLIKYQTVGLFVNTLTADDKYSHHSRENFLQQIQMQLSQKPKKVSEVFFAFLKCATNPDYFEKKYEPHSLSISEIVDYERGDYFNV